MMDIYAKISGGNIKLGDIGSFSKLYSDEYISTQYGDVLGTCGNYCKECKPDCYVKKSYRHPSVKDAHARNTIAFRTNLLKSFDEIHEQLRRKKKPFYAVRINQSGEIETVEELLFWIYTARMFPKTYFYIYTKNTTAIDAIIKKYLQGRLGMPDNFTLLISIWKEYGQEYLQYMTLPFIKFFVVMVDGYEYPFSIETTCTAYDENGKLNHAMTCKRCKKCIHSKFKFIGCYEH